MRFLLFVLLLINISFANSLNISRMNALKSVIQKEEYIALAINKYILQTGTIPKTDSNKLDWEKLEHKDYLGELFNRKNLLTSDDIDVYYEPKTYNFFIRGVVANIGTLEEPESSYDEDLKYLYNFYASRIFRVNTLAPIDTTVEKLKIGSQVLYSSIQKEIVQTVNLSSNNTIKLDSQDCVVNTHYYELKGKELTYKYCKTVDNPITVYQDSPIYVEDSSELKYIKAKIGDKAYAKKNGIWYEYYYQGDTNLPWVAVYLGSDVNEADESQDLEDLILKYIPGSKDLVFRQDGGCMLANGDIFCWGNNKYKKVGIESYGQIDKTLKPDYVNTPIMLKAQIDKTKKYTDDNGIESTRHAKNWYNNPYRVKFEKMAMNSTNVCAISPIFLDPDEEFSQKVGGDLFCNGNISSSYFEDLSSTVKSTSILKKNIFFGIGKEDKTNDGNEIYLKDIVMVEDTAAVLSDTGDIYTFGRNYKGALGIGSSDKFIISTTPSKINGSTIFKKIFALRDIRGFGAIDEENYFWIWGGRPNGEIYNKPTRLNDNRRYNEDAIFINTNEFVLKGLDNFFYQTTNSNSTKKLNIPNTAISVSVYGNFFTYINEYLELKGSPELLKCMKANEIDECNNDDNSNDIFTLAFNQLNTKLNNIKGKMYATFTNAGIFKLDRVLSTQSENFETATSGWTATNSSDNNMITTVDLDQTDTQTQLPSTDFLGRFPIAVNETKDYYEVSKTYSFPSYPNHEIDIEFDFYEIDTWDGERFEVYANGELLSVDHFIFDWHETLKDTNITGINLQDNINPNTGYAGDQSYSYKLRSKLDSSGNVTLKFKTQFEYDLPYANHYSRTYYQGSYNEDVENESWGIDNVKIKVKETNKKFVCAMTGFGSKSQMYCWGNIARSIPILSTSLYDMDKINSINKLFITEESDKEIPMSYDKFNNDGNLHLKFPTYIGGFDYEFYFK